ncbi:MAG: tetratricopeptide repeat protein [Verrucomicrobiota bacterium]
MTATASQPPRRRLEWALGLLILLITLAVFWPAVRGEFLRWDDDINILENTHIRSLSAENLRWMGTDMGYVRRYIPLTWLGFAVNNAVFGQNPKWYHAGNIGLHGLSALLVYLILRQLLTRRYSPKPAEWTAAPAVCAALGALWWALNPLRVEVVAWASGRIYCQAVLLLLVALWAYLQYTLAEPGAAGRRWWYVTSLAASAASLLTYPLALALPLLLVILDFFALQRFNRGLAGCWDAQARRLWIEKIPYILMVMAVLAVTLWARTQNPEFWEPPPTLAEFGLAERVMQAFYIWGHYLWRPWWPVDLAAVYTRLVAFRPMDLPFVLSAMGVVGISGVLGWHWRRWPGLLGIWLGYLVFLVPMLGLTEHPHYPSDRYGYFVGLLWPMLIAGGLCGIWRKTSLRMLVMVVSVGWLVLCSGLSIRQISTWQNSEVFFKHIIRTLGMDNYRADIHRRLGREYALRGQLDAAIESYTAALAMLPNFPVAHGELGQVYELQGKLDQALEHYAAAARIQPTELRVAMLAAALARAGKTTQAIQQYQEILRLKPDWSEGLNNLAWLLATASDASARDGIQSVQLAERACTLTSRKNAACLGTLAAAYAEAGRFPAAVAAAQEAIAAAKAVGDTVTANINQRLLEGYQQGHAFHEVPAPKAP